jgi:hypothetical protein
MQQQINTKKGTAIWLKSLSLEIIDSSPLHTKAVGYPTHNHDSLDQRWRGNTVPHDF